jgi:hypothetical protein
LFDISCNLFFQALAAAGIASVRQKGSMTLVATSIGGTGDVDNSAIEMDSKKVDEVLLL